MLVPKLVFFCWLIATCFRPATSEAVTQEPPHPSATSPDQGNSNTLPSTTVDLNSPSSPASPPEPTAQEPPDTPITTTASPDPGSSSMPISTTVDQNSPGSSVSPPAPTTQNPPDTPITATASPDPGSSSMPTSTVDQGSPGTSASPPVPTTKGNESPGTSSKTPSPSTSPTPGVTVSPGTQVTSAPAMSSPTPESSATTISNGTIPTEPSTVTTADITTSKVSACSSNPCPFDSTCIGLPDGFTCQCFRGSFFSGGSCNRAKVFAGDLHLTALSFEREMEDTGSAIFQQTAESIMAAMREALEGTDGYIKSEVLQLRNGSVQAIVDNIYRTTSSITQKNFELALNNAIEQCENNCDILKSAEFTALDLCKLKPAPCNKDTTTCEINDGIVSCTCQPGYIKSNFSDRSCSACPSGQKKDNNKCVPCPFGYAGFNCNDSSLLAVVVVSCVLGGLLLILLLVFILRGSRTKKDYNSPYPPAEETRTTWSNAAQVPKIPRASANINSQWDPSHLEMTESGSTRALVSKERPGNGAMGSYDDLRTFTGKNPSRYSYLVQGQDNPHFISDDFRGTK